jgi:hypothetical protein
MIVAATKPESADKVSVRDVLDKVRAEERDALTAPERGHICDAYGIPTPGDGLATTAHEATWLAEQIGGVAGVQDRLARHPAQDRDRQRDHRCRANARRRLGDTEVEKACEYRFHHQVVAYPYTTERPVAVLGAKYRWATAARLLDS